MSAPVAQLLYPTCTTERADRWQDLHDQFDVFLDPDLARRTTASDVAVELRLDDRAGDRKVAALRAPASQTAELVAAVGEDRFLAWTAVESFTDASPGREIDADVRAGHVGRRHDGLELQLGDPAPRRA